MRCTQTEFEAISRRHRMAIERRGYIQAVQVGYDTAVWKCLVRRLLRRTIVSYRTYWRVKNRELGSVFAKVYFGNADPRNVFKQWEYELRFLRLCRSEIRAIPEIEWPDMLDAWSEEDFAIVTYRWVELEKLSPLQILNGASARAAIRHLLESIRRLSAPDGWSQTGCAIDYCMTKLAPPSSSLAPCNIDFYDNLAQCRGGRLFAHDFEKWRWSTAGLQESLLLLRRTMEARGCNVVDERIMMALSPTLSAGEFERCLPQSRAVLGWQWRAKFGLPLPGDFGLYTERIHDWLSGRVER